MKIVTKAGALAKALRIAGFIAEPRNTIPVLGCVKFDGARILATNLDMEIEAAFPAAQADGSVCVDFRSLKRLVGNIPADETITIETTDKGVSLAFGSGIYDLHTFPAKDFPEFDMPNAMPFHSATDQLVDAFRFAANFVSNEETRYYLNGVCLDGDLAVATNGHVLGHAKTGIEFEGRPIIPRHAIDTVNKIGPFKLFAVNAGKLRAEFRFDGVTLRTNLIDGTFPEWQRVVPAIKDRAPRLTVKRSELLATIKRMSAVKSGVSHYVTLAAQVDSVALYSEHHDIGTARERLPSALVENAPEPVTISFDAKYLVKLCGAHNRSDTISLAFNDAGSPCLIMSDMKGVGSILMPVRSGNDREAVASIDMLARRPIDLGRAA